MLRIQNIALSLDGGIPQLKKKAARILDLRPEAVTGLTLARQSIDARKKSDVHYVCTVDVAVTDEEKVLARCRDRRVSLHRDIPYAFPPVRRSSSLPPVVVGMGPAGLFAALYLARNGLAPIVLERGRPVEERTTDVERFWSTGQLDPASNVQFGEGGAGTFSDGKLNTGTHDPRIATVFRELVAAGAPADILYQHKPHIGTDVLRDVVKNIRLELLRLGCDVRFGHKLSGLTLRDGAVAGLTVEGPQGAYQLPCDALVLSPGHSARDTFQMLHGRGAAMEAKPFAVGVRIEHRQADCDAAQYRQYAGHPGLPASTYKLSCHLPNGRAAYSFCVCPGGQVVAAASEAQRVVTNGMSEFARDQENINGGLLVNVTPEDYGGTQDPLAGIAFQRRLEAAAYDLGGGGYRAPAQRVGDFLAGRPSTGPGRVKPSYRPGVTWTDLRQCLPDFVADTLAGALPLLGQKLRGYDDPDAVLTAVESRSSSPVRIPRDETYQSSLRGLYPCGEGAGYAGGILSAAADGMRCAEQLCQSNEKGS